MKKIIVVILLVVCIGLMFVGCSSNNTNTTEECYLFKTTDDSYIIKLLYKSEYFLTKFYVEYSFTPDDTSSYERPYLYGNVITDIYGKYLNYNAFEPNTFIYFIVPSKSTQTNSIHVRVRSDSHYVANYYINLPYESD